MSVHRISIASPPDRDKLVAMIDCGGEQWAEINAESEALTIELYPRQDGMPWVFSLSDATAAIEAARNRLLYASNGDIQAAVALAASILDGSTPLFLGCKQLVGPLDRLGLHHEEPFVAITGIDSELDEYPVEPQDRANWNQQRLAARDAEFAAWLAEVQGEVFDACRALLQRFGSQIDTQR
jgi:hypothetical protein